ncbi:helix-turn-helix transcriptional regulator [Spirosoma validum]|uniref:WYL domain-containing protein n=1 Tax=Spirosoma validum TaxID=2771355 RepID=A0A927AZI2_9BACT|nr:WYL domain-containing protein [Spirosoma validum]MBD2752751.1 WYL domain-containing protein [Spirosoma validum]
MPANRNALIRYRAIDTCLANKYRQWTLEALIDAVSEALYEYEGMDKGISRRTIQADLQMMRSDKLGYNAPIIVIDKKYYAYADPAYSITQIPLTGQDLGRISEAVEVLKQFKGFSHFEQLSGVVQKLEAHIYSASTNQRTIIDFEKNDNLKGLTHLDVLYRTIVQRQAISVTYQSFKAHLPAQFRFHVWWLKEFKNRWFAVGVRGNQKEVQHLALDRIISIESAEETAYRDNPGITASTYYQDVIGVTVSQTLRPCNVLICVATEHAPYVETKPLHHSQQLVERRDDGIVIRLEVQLNFELEREILSFGDGMTVLAPARLRERIRQKLKNGLAQYEEDEKIDL